MEGVAEVAVEAAEEKRQVARSVERACNRRRREDKRHYSQAMAKAAVEYLDIMTSLAARADNLVKDREAWRRRREKRGAKYLPRTESTDPCAMIWAWGGVWFVAFAIGVFLGSMLELQRRAPPMPELEMSLVTLSEVPAQVPLSVMSNSHALPAPSQPHPLSEFESGSESEPDLESEFESGSESKSGSQLMVSPHVRISWLETGGISSSSVMVVRAGSDSNSSRSTITNKDRVSVAAIEATEADVRAEVRDVVKNRSDRRNDGDENMDDSAEGVEQPKADRKSVV